MKMDARELVKLIKETPSEWAKLPDAEKAALKTEWQSGLKAAGQILEASLTGPRAFRRKFPEGVVEPGEKRADKPYWKDWQKLQAEKVNPIGALQGKTLTRPRDAEITLADGSRVKVTLV